MSQPLSLLTPTIYLACEHCHGTLKDKRKIYAWTHTCPVKWCILTHLHSHQEVLTSQDIEGLQVQASQMCIIQILTFNVYFWLLSLFFFSTCVCVWQFLLAWCADPSSTPTVNPVRPGVILTLTFGRWTRDAFFLLLPSHTFSCLVLSFLPPSPIPPFGKAWPSITVTLWGHLPPC